MPATSTAAATNVSASTATMPVNPAKPTATPPSGAPTSRATFWLTAVSAFAADSWPGATRLGMRASVAGPHSLASTAWPAATR